MLFYHFGVKAKKMKGSRGRETAQSKQGPVNTPRPEIRDDLDSRERKDAGYKEKTSKAGRKPNSRDKDKYGS